MADTTQSSEELKARTQAIQAEIEAKRKEVKAKEEVLAETSEALKQAERQEKLELIEKQLVPAYRELREKENEVNQAVNELFNKTALEVEKINALFEGLETSKKEAANLEDEIIRSDGDPASMRQVIRSRRTEVTAEIEIAEPLKGAMSIVADVNRALGFQQGTGRSVGLQFGGLSQAGRVYELVSGYGKRSFRVKEGDLIRVAGISQTRIIQARDDLVKCLDELKEASLIEYEVEGDTYVITNIGKEPKAEEG